ncbi:MAG: hypothetical protein PHY08_10120 [Candidatus Cloacimonetes bacterium]|nr:hypothetical protein [Candidatus Cloacimonadota bacterium]
MVNQTVPAKIFKTESKYGPGFEIVFPELKSNYVAPTPNVDTSSISKKLDEILGILHAHFPTASDMSGDSLDDEELTFTAE